MRDGGDPSSGARGAPAPQTPRPLPSALYPVFLSARRCMDNPWLLLPAAQPFVVQADAAVVAAFNRKYAGTPYALHTELPPEPFSGRLDAPVVLLDFHPDYRGNDAAIMPGNEEFSLSMKKTRGFIVQKYPFYHLNPCFEAGNDGYGYWVKKIKEVVKAGFSLKVCSNSFLLLQLYPYKSKQCDRCRLFPSFAFTRHILLAAMQRRALVVQLRSRKKWEDAVPELETYPHRIHGHSPRQATLSPGNLGSEGWRLLLSALDAG